MYSVPLEVRAENFIKNAIRKHKNKYSYNKVNYVSAHIKVEIFCNRHKKYFEQEPANHLTGRGCPDCGNDTIKIFNKLKQY